MGVPAPSASDSATTDRPAGCLLDFHPCSEAYLYRRQKGDKSNFQYGVAGRYGEPEIGLIPFFDCRAARRSGRSGRGALGHARAPADDPDGYRRLAENLVEHGTFGAGGVPTAFRPPLYPWLLVPCVAMGPAGRVAIGVLHVLLGVGTVWVAYRLARRCRLGGWSWLAAGLVALDPILLGQSAVVMTETAATLLVALAMLCLGRERSSRPPRAGLPRAALCWRLASLCRPELLPRW